MILSCPGFNLQNILKTYHEHSLLPYPLYLATGHRIIFYLFIFLRYHTYLSVEVWLFEMFILLTLIKKDLKSCLTESQ